MAKLCFALSILRGEVPESRGAKCQHFAPLSIKSRLFSGRGVGAREKWGFPAYASILLIAALSATRVT